MHRQWEGRGGRPCFGTEMTQLEEEEFDVAGAMSNTTPRFWIEYSVV